MRFSTLTLGCKVNQYETQAIEGILISRGHERATPGGACDVCIINTCAVTSESVRKSRQAVRRVKKTRPGAMIAVCGCFPQLEPVAAALLGADIVGGSGDRRKFALEVEGAFNARFGNGQAAPYVGRAGAVTGNPADRRVFEELEPVAAGRTRAFLKIQDGCDNYCAYCVIPYVRGASRSLPIARAVDFARSLEGQGFREIVITGIEISAYGGDLEEKQSLAGVIRAIGQAAPGARLRLGSLDPCLVTERFCGELSGVSNLCPHFHLSLQSGCDDTLRRMGRGYGADAARGAIALLRGWFPNCGITADLITGFPGETDDEFGRTICFIESASFSGMHVFPFSSRPGTRAAVMPGQVDKAVRQERARVVSAVAAGMADEFRRCQVGRVEGVLFEQKRGGFWVGHSGNYVMVAVKRGGGRNMLLPVRITEAADGFVLGEVVKG